MKIICVCLLFALLGNTANAESLKFAATVNNEELAEEAITLLHCLAEKTDGGWEFTGEISGSHWLKVKEAGSALSGIYHSGKEETSFKMKAGEAESTCARLIPAEEKISLAPPPSDSALQTRILTEDKKSYLPWALGIGVAAVIGFIILGHSGPDHRAMQMN
jgi:hypothetical protein